MNQERSIPPALEAERAVLGAMLMSPHAIEEAADIVQGEDFYQPVNGRIFEAIVAAHGGLTPVDPVTISAKLGSELRPAGGIVYLHDCISSASSPASAGHYAEIVYKRAVRRRAFEHGIRGAQMACETDDDDVPEMLDRLQADAFALTAGRAEAEEDPSNADAMAELLEDIENGSEATVRTGFRDLDALLNGGLHPGQVVVIAARSAMGKSTLALDIHRQVSIVDGEHSILFTTEMGRKEILKRALCAEAKVPFSHMHPGKMLDGDWERVARHHARVSEAPIHIIDPPDLTLTQVRTRSRRLARRYPIRLITVDYAQQVLAPGRRGESRQQEVSEVSRGLKALAKELNVTVIAVAQLNRGPEQRQDKKPMMSDMRESGALEQDADVVILPYRPDYYEKESPRAGEADLIVAKHRNGPTAEITVAFQGHYSRFVNMASDSYGSSR